MSEFEEKLNSVLSDPDAMAQIMSLAQSLSGQMNGAPSGDGAQPSDETRPPADGQPAGGAQPSGNGPGGDPSALLSQLDPELLRRLIPLIQQMNRPESSEAAAFLHALRPFLSEARRGKVDRAAQLARLIHLGKTFLISQEG